MRRDGPNSAHNFRVTAKSASFDGRMLSKSFAEISRIGVDSEQVEYREGGDDPCVRNMAGLTRCTRITCMRGITGDIGFHNWLLAGIQVQRADGSIIQWDESLQGVTRWNLRCGWSCNHTGPILNVASHEFAMETVAKCHEGLKVGQ